MPQIVVSYVEYTTVFGSCCNYNLRRSDIRCIYIYATENFVANNIIYAAC